MAVSIGQTVGDYRVIGVIGAGGMGTVYQVQHLISDRIEAMKVVLPNLAETAELAERFIREIKLQARLSHPNIAALHNALRHEDQLLMVMEYVDGTTLHKRLQQSALPVATSVEIATQILRALSYAHAQGVIHRDIKPANIMLTANNVVKLMDFGIARSQTDLHLTRTGVAVGSVYYMSPEQVRGTDTDARSDLYSVGVMLYEMVTGVRPIDGESSWAVMNAHLTRIPEAPISLNQNVPPMLSAGILRSLEKGPGERFQNALEFVDFLEAVSHRLTPAHHGDPRKTTAKVFEHETQVARPAAPLYPAAMPTPTPSGANATVNTRFDPDGLARVTRELAAYVGPLAKVLVSRASKKAQNWKQLYDALAAEVPAGDERKRFLAKRPL